MYAGGGSDGRKSAKQTSASPSAHMRSLTAGSACAAFVRDARKASKAQGARVADDAAEDTASSIDVQEAVSSIDMQEVEEEISLLHEAKVATPAVGNGEEMAVTDEDDASTDGDGEEGRQGQGRGERGFGLVYNDGDIDDDDDDDDDIRALEGGEKSIEGDNEIPNEHWGVGEESANAATGKKPLTLVLGDPGPPVEVGLVDAKLVTIGVESANLGYRTCSVGEYRCDECAVM